MAQRSTARKPSARPLPSRGRDRQRGVALLLVITVVTILTAVSVDFSYNSRVDLELATNARDELRAYYLAKSSVAFSRLILKFQKQLDSTPMGFDPSMLMGLLGGGMPTPGANGAPGSPAFPPAGSGGVPIRLWQMIPVDCSILQMLLGGAGIATPNDASLAPKFGEKPALPKLGAVAPGGPAQLASFGDFDGCFHSEMQDEDQKINVNRIADGWQNGAVSPIVAAYRLFSDQRFAFLFDKEDANHVKMSPMDTTLALVDWIDYDETQAAGTITPQGQIQLTAGFGDENRNYSHYPHTYKAKNNRFDSLDELYMVDGVSDEFMAAFRDRLTVYSDINDKYNINTDDPLLLWSDISAADSNQMDRRLTDPVFMHTVLQEIAMMKGMLPFFGMSLTQFQGVLQQNGIPVSASFMAAATDKSNTFTIHATGTAGKVEKNITAVVNFRDPRGMGRLVYWHED